MRPFPLLVHELTAKSMSDTREPGEMHADSEVELERLKASMRSVEEDLEREKLRRVEAEEMSKEMQVNVLLEGSKWKAELDKYKDILRHSTMSASSAIQIPDQEGALLFNVSSGCGPVEPTDCTVMPDDFILRTSLDAEVLILLPHSQSALA